MDTLLPLDCPAARAAYQRVHEITPGVLLMFWHSRTFSIFGLIKRIAIVSPFVLGGCDSFRSPENREESPPHVRAIMSFAASGAPIVVAQGKLEPAGGVRPILVPAGDRVAKVNVTEGDVLTEGQTLVVLQSLAARETELAVAQTQLSEARRSAAAASAVAKANLDVATTVLARAQLEFKQAQDRISSAKAPGGEFDLLNQQVELSENKLDQIRSAFNDRSAGRLVSQSSLDQQELVVSRARSAAESARIDAEQSIERGRLSVESASRELEAAKLSVASSIESTKFDSLEKQIELLRLQVDATRVQSPIAGLVLRVDATPGQATTGVPLLHVADLTEMVCRAEIDVAELRNVALDAAARITSPALAQPLVGHVRSISRMMGSPQLPSPYPTAPVDWRSAEVIILIDEADTAAAARLINLQVDVAIEVTSEATLAPLPASKTLNP